MEKNGLNLEKSALVVIDLQKGIASPDRHLAPYSAKEVIQNASDIAAACRKRNIPVFLVHVMPSPETALKVESDSSMSSGNREVPKDWADFVKEMKPENKDIAVTKHQWGAFYGTDLDMQLRRRGIKTIILCGIATSIGVESTARFAYEYGYNQVFPEDAMTSMSKEEHEASLNIFRRIGKVRNTRDVLEALENN